MTKGFGTIFDFYQKTMRRYYVDEKNVKRWADNDEPCFPDEAKNDD